jgi:hypothetical protein
MRCQEAFEALSARFDGELRATEIPLLQAHLAGCPDCRRREGELGQVARRLRGAAVEQAAVPAALRARITRSIAPPAPRRVPFVFGLAFLGAGVSLGALAMVARARPAIVSPTELSAGIRIEGEGAVAQASFDGADEEWARVSQLLAEEGGQGPSGASADPARGGGILGHRMDVGDGAGHPVDNGGSEDERDAVGGRFPAGTPLSAGNEIQAGRRSIEVAIGSWGHLSLAPGGRLQVGHGPAELTLLAGRATVDVRSSAHPLLLRAAEGEVMMPEGRYEIRAATARGSDPGEAVGSRTTVVAQVSTFEGRARVSNGTGQIWVGAGSRGWLRPDQPPLDRLGGAPSAPVATALTAPAGEAIATAAVPAAPGTSASATSGGSAAAPGAATATSAEATAAATSSGPPPSGAVAATRGEAEGHGRLHGVVTFSASEGAGSGGRRASAAQGDCPPQVQLAYVRLSPASADLGERRARDRAREGDRPAAAPGAPGIPASVPVDLDACGLNPGRVTIGLGQSLELRNRGEVTRRVSLPGGETTTLAAGAVEHLRFGGSGHFELTCDGAGPCGQISVGRAPVMATTDAQGGFAVDRVPAGVYSVTAWRSDRASASAQVDVRAGSTTEVRLNLPDDLPEAVAALAPSAAPPAAPSAGISSASGGDGAGSGVGAAAVGAFAGAPGGATRTSDLRGAGWPLGVGRNDCHFARGDSQVALACAQGGVKEAKRTMKAMIKLAKDRGKRFDCDTCHRNEEDWQLTPDARALFAKVVETIRT